MTGSNFDSHQPELPFAESVARVSRCSIFQDSVGIFGLTSERLPLIDCIIQSEPYHIISGFTPATVLIR